MNVSWQSPIDGEGAGGRTTEYHLNVTLLTAQGKEEVYSITTQSTSVLVRSLHPNYLYQCSVVPRTAAGPGPLSVTLILLPPDGWLTYYLTV